jgi:2'-5' RNA ligase
MRLFFAINFPKAVKDSFLAVQNDLRRQTLRGNFTLYDNLHLTLVFIGEVNEARAQALRRIAGGLKFEPFTLGFTHLGRFRRDVGDLVWAGAEKSVALLSAYDALAEQVKAAGFSIDTRPYTPHLTLARAVRFRDGFSLTGYSGAMKPVETVVTSASLMKSERIDGRLVYTALRP